MGSLLETTNHFAFEGEEKERYDLLMGDIYSGSFTLSPSSLRHFMLSPRHFVLSRVVKQEVSESLKLGILVDNLLMNGGETKIRFIDFEERPEKGKTMASNMNKAWKEEVLEEIGPDNLLPKDVYDTGVMMAEMVMADPEAASILEKSTSFQRFIEWEMFGEKFRGIIDVDCPDEINDVKTCRDAHVNKFRWSITDKDRRYDCQLAGYREGDGNGKNCSIIAVDRNGHVSVIDLTFQTLDTAMMDIKYAVEGFKRCREEKLWHMSYSFWSDSRRYRV